MNRDKQVHLHSITEFGCQYAGTIMQVQIESKCAPDAALQRLTIDDRGDLRAATFFDSPKYRKPTDETVRQIDAGMTAKIFSEIASFLASRASAFAPEGGYWDILVLDGNGKTFTGSGPLREDVPSQRLSEVLRDSLGLDFCFFDGRQMEY